MLNLSESFTAHKNSRYSNTKSLLSEIYFQNYSIQFVKDKSFRQNKSFVAYLKVQKCKISNEVQSNNVNRGPPAEVSVSHIHITK